MPQEPKRHHSRARQGKRRSSISLTVPDTNHKLNKYNQMLEADKVKSVVTKTEETDDE